MKLWSPFSAQRFTAHNQLGIASAKSVTGRMAWTSHGTTNQELVQALVNSKLLVTPRVIAAFSSVDRKYFIPHIHTEKAYLDSPQPLEPRDESQGATISAPHMHASAVEALGHLLKPGSRVLDVGSGSGYLLAVFHHLVAGSGSLVLGIDHIPFLVEQSQHNLARLYAPDPIPSQIQLFCHDGRKPLPEPYLDGAGFDCIHVGAAADRVPDSLIERLKLGGRMWIPVSNGGRGESTIWVLDKDMNGNVEKKKLFGVRYVPLTDRLP